MVNAIKVDDVMDSLLGTAVEDSIPGIDELNCLIYRNEEDIPTSMLNSQGGENTQLDEGENISVNVWESRAKIRIKVSPETKANVSIEGITTIAVNAITEELKRMSK